MLHLQRLNADVSLQQIDTQHEMFKHIYELIVEDNGKSGVRPRGSDASLDTPINSLNGTTRLSNHTGRPLSMPDAPSPNNHQVDELFFSSSLNSNSPRPTVQSTQHMPQLPQSPFQRKQRPAVQPKPESLQMRMHQSSESSRPTSSTGDPLAERFSQFRIQGPSVPLSRKTDQRNTQRNSRGELPSPTEYTPSTSEDSSSMNSSLPSEVGASISSSKPSGPRNMPAHPTVPAPPPKIPLNSEHEDVYPAMPRAPVPAYDPSKSVVTPMNTNIPTLNRKRSIIGTDPAFTRSPKRNSGVQILPNGFSPPSRSSSVQPRQTCISAAELYERLRTTKVLLIDVRSREEFDSGHITATSVMCIEPVSIHSGLAAEELQERLVVSPEAELSYFEMRDEFDFVVYYDQSTESDQFLRGPPTRVAAASLRALHDTLYEFNDYKPLRRPPLVLIGGLDAWIDLVGPHALEASKTAVLVGTIRARRPQPKSGRPLGRVPMASANSSLEVRKRRLREQKSLNPDEERRWLEKARKEEVDPADYQMTQSDGETDSNGEEPPSPFVHTYEDFLRRFPEASPIQQSMMIAYPPPPPPTRIPPYSPPRDVPSVPSRPAPAVPRPSYSGVSERESSSQLSPISRKTSAAQQPFYQPRSVSHYLKLPRTGLMNFGVTCYMNATIQCLLATIPLSQFFLDDRWRSLTQKNWKGSNGVLPTIFANLIRSLWANDVQAVRPTSFRNFCARLKDEWGVDRQQDAKEFFDFVVDCLHEDLNRNFDRTALRPLTSTEEMQRERWPVAKVSSLEWARYTHREHSYISDLFAGQHASRLRCTTCRNTSTTYEAFYSVSVEIPRTNFKRDGSGWDIHDCLRSYCKEEMLSGDEVWKCPYCKCEREATKQITITRAPQFLVVHFKRFEMRKGDAKKVHTPIQFPLFGLNMGNYMIAPPDPKDDTARGPRDQLDGLVADPATQGPYLYDAYAVMRHLGSSGNGGHYISLVRDAARGCWRKFDDERVTDFDPAKLRPEYRLQNEQAYILFYGRAVAR